MKRQFFITLMATLFALALMFPAFAWEITLDAGEVSGEGSITLEDDCGEVSGEVTVGGRTYKNSIGSCEE